MNKGISVCMIVKNEEKVINRAIGSCLLFADEVIVVDTGSTDKTKEIVDNLGGIVTLFSDDWNNDFSEARNKSIGLAEYSWILWIDADDIIPLATAEKLVALKNAPLDHCFQFLIKNTVNHIAVGSQFMQMRMFPNRPEIRFKGPIHEQIAHATVKLGLEEVPLDLEIWHTGYELPEVRKEKAVRNGKLMEMHGYGDGNSTEIIAVGNNHFILEEYQKGLDFFKKITNSPQIKQVEPVCYETALVSVGHGYLMLEQYEKAIEYFEQADPQNIDAVYQKAQCYHALLDLETALDIYADVLLCPERLSVQTTNHHYCRMHAFHCSWSILVGFKHNKEALVLLDKMHQSYPEFRIVNYA